MLNKTKNIAKNIGIKTVPCAHQPSNDIGLYISSKEISNEIRALLLNSHWEPTANYEFPYSIRTNKGKETKRYLNHKHLQDHKWCKLSPSQKGLFCVPCVLFGPATKSVHGQNLNSFVSKPFQKYYKLGGTHGVLYTHENTTYHKNAVLA